MKNIGVKLLLVVLSLSVLQACGETEKERRAKEQARMDSLRKAQQQEIAEEMARLEREKEETSDVADTQSEEKEMNNDTAEYSFTENGQYAVQVGAFRSEDKAKGYISKWSDRNYPSAYTVKIGEEEYGDVWFRVRVGFFSTKEDAEKLGAELAKEINSGYWVSKVR